MKQTVAITGASGAMGQALAQGLQREEHPVLCLVRSPLGPDSRPFDLGDPLSTSIDGVHTLVHLAWETADRSREAQDRSVAATAKLARRSAEVGVRFLFVSTASILSQPRSMYAEAKREAEEIVLEAGGTVVRPGLMVGRGASGLWNSLERLARLPVTPVPRSLRVFVVTVPELVGGLCATLSGSPAVRRTHHSVKLTDVLRYADAVPLPVPVPVRLLSATAKRLRRRISFADSLLGILATPLQVTDDEETRYLTSSSSELLAIDRTGR